METLLYPLPCFVHYPATPQRITGPIFTNTMLFDIFIGLLTGLYSGLIASKYIRYVHIRADALRLVKHIEYLNGHAETKITVLRQRDLDQLAHYSHELEYLGYDTLATLIQQVENTLRDANAQPEGDPNIELHIDAWLNKIKHQRPAIVPTLAAWRI